MSMVKSIDDNVKKMKWLDRQLVKLAIVAGVLFIVSLFSSGVLTEIVSLRWVWLILLVIFLIKPVYQWTKK